MYLEREDVNLYYETYGEGEPLLLIHGVIVDASFISRRRVCCPDTIRSFSMTEEETPAVSAAGKSRFP